MSEMFFLRLGKDHNVIQINHNINIKKIIENIIDKILKRGSRIGGSKRHNQILITAIFSLQTGQVLINLLDSEQVICTMPINLGEDRRTIKDSEKIIHRRNRILFLPSNSIEFAELGWMKPPAQYDDHRRGEEELSLLSTWTIHSSTGDEQKEQPSSRFLSLLVLPLHPTTTPGSHDKMKEEGPYSQRRDEVKIKNYLPKHLESI
ncbi:hypothetical protein O181_057484 [Austropuccinia psidii MF-1]|uniref:Uncharacterized protein n=1 Tax=Austropuccinia psidii MF-1 TaxID=1389203 RepID=A0A9Q3EAJ2_9BASI|nr:hypothetical protein [Austropuccinia psidii MF-1]